MTPIIKIDITNEFKKYKVPISNETMEDYCLPKKFTLQPQQLFLADFLSSKFSPWILDNNVRGTLLYHQIGSGKTCTAISIAEKFKKKLNIIVILPAALIANFLNELRSECCNEDYLSNKDRDEIQNLDHSDIMYKKIIDKSNIKINKYYTIYSYHIFNSLVINKKIKNFNNVLLIIDEIQNMISINGIFYKSLKQIINNSNDSLKILLLSGTPIFDKPIEIALTLNLLKKNNLISIKDFNQQYLKSISTDNGINYKIKNIKNFTNKISNLISFYRGAPPQSYPLTKFKIVKCNMSNFQYKSYLTSLCTDEKILKGSFKNVDILELSPSFYLGPRLISNIAFPNKSIGEIGFNSFIDNYLQLQNIKKYSIKFYKIFKNIKKTEGLVFIYSNFKDFGGIKCFIKFIEYHGWKNFSTFNEGLKRFAIWSGDESKDYKNEINSIFNNKNNANGSKIKLILGTPSIKEGVTLLRVQQVHILEPYWNISRILQIIGRAVRFCSHKDVPKNKRLVKVYLYLATYPNVKTIDEYIWFIANEKKKLINKFEEILKEYAFDCKILFNRNYYSTDKKVLLCKS